MYYLILWIVPHVQQSNFMRNTPVSYAVQSAQKINRVTRRTKFVTHLAHFVRYAREVRYFARKVRYFAREVNYLARVFGTYLLQAKLSQCGSTYFFYVVECITFEGAHNSELKAALRHTRHNQCSEGLSGLIRSKLEEWIDMDNLAANCQDPCGHPCFIALFMLVLWAF